MNENKDLGTQGTEDTLKGKLNKAAGKVQKNVGKATDNEEMQAKGKAKEMGGTVQSKAGQAERKVDEKIDESANRTDRPNEERRLP